MRGATKSLIFERPASTNTTLSTHPLMLAQAVLLVICSGVVLPLTNAAMVSSKAVALQKRANYLGCFTDSIPRVLSYGAAYSPDYFMGATDCINYCISCGFALAGVEYGEECYCGNGFLHDYGSSTACSMPCRGNSLETCGGSNALNVYTTGVRPYTTGPATAPASYNGYSLTQCWQNDQWAGSRILPNWPTTPILPEQMSISKCIDGCAASGYSSAGVEWGQECWCGNIVFPPGESTDFSECDMPCQGDAGQLCGGSNRILIYHKP